MFFKNSFHDFRIAKNLLRIVLKLWCECLPKSHSLGCDDVHMWTSLESRKHGFIDFFSNLLTFSYQDQSSARSPQGFMSSRSDHIKSKVKWVFEGLASNESSNMSHISHCDRPNFASNLYKPSNPARIIFGRVSWATRRSSSKSISPVSGSFIL